MSAVVVAGIFFLCISFFINAVSFCAPFWLNNHNNYQDMGLWGHGYCDRDMDSSTNAGASDTSMIEKWFDSCAWRWAWDEDWAWEKDKYENYQWFVATQGLFGFGVVTLLFSFGLACVHLCCIGKKETTSILITIALLTLLAVALIAVGMIIFGIFAWVDQDFQASVHSSTFRYNWAFYLGIAGVFLATFGAVLYLIQYCREGRAHRGYERGDIIS